MIKVLEHAGNAMVYGLKRYRWGSLPDIEMRLYVQHTALLWEYNKKASELMEAGVETPASAEVYEADYKCKRKPTLPYIFI